MSHTVIKQQQETNLKGGLKNKAKQIPIITSNRITPMSRRKDEVYQAMFTNTTLFGGISKCIT